MANLNGVGSFHEFHEFQRRFRWKYGQLERGREFPWVPRVSKKISLKVWPTWTGSGVSTSSTSFKEDFIESMANLNWVGSFKEDFVESMANLNGVGSFHEFHEFHEFQRRFRWKYGQLELGREFQRRFRWKYGQLERGQEFPRVPRVSKKISLKVWATWTGSGVSKKISLKVWPTWTGSGVSTSSTSFKENFVESMANVNDHQPLFESKERQRSSEIKEDGLRFVLRVSEELYLNIYWI